MLRHRGLRNARLLGHALHGLFAVAREPLEDRAAGGIGQAFEESVGRRLHDSIHNHLVMD